MIANNWPKLALGLGVACAALLAVSVLFWPDAADDAPAGHNAAVATSPAVAAAPVAPTGLPQPAPAVVAQNEKPAAITPDPFKAFIEASKNGQVTPVPSQASDAPQPMPRDPFKAFMEAAKKQAPASPAVPFTRKD